MSKYLQFKIELLDISPLIWRRIRVPSSYTFWDLHVAIQDSMGWQDSHLHAFEVPDSEGNHSEIGLPDPYGETDVLPGWKRKIEQFFENPGDQLVYEYDFGDSWRHSVQFEQTGQLAETASLPVCTGGESRCPPENCGGPPGFEMFLAAVSDPEHEDHESMLNWHGGEYDTFEFSAEAVVFDDPQKRLKALFD